MPKPWLELCAWAAFVIPNPGLAQLDHGVKAKRGVTAPCMSLPGGYGKQHPNHMAGDMSPTHRST